MKRNEVGISLKTIRAIHEAAQNKSMTIAANKLGMTQSAVTQHVQRFENHFGLKFISRAGNSMTIEREDIATIIDTLVRTTDQLYKVINEKPDSRPSVSIPIPLAPILFSNMAAVKSLSKQFRICVDTPSCSENQNDFDITFRILHPYEKAPLNSFMLPVSWISKLSFEKKSDNVQNLSLILSNKKSPLHQWALQYCKRIGIVPHTVAIVDDPLLQMSCVAQGWGLALVPSKVIKLNSQLTCGAISIVDFMQKFSIEVACLGSEKLTLLENEALFSTIEKLLLD